jgi:hypothetical protein
MDITAASIQAWLAGRKFDLIVGVHSLRGVAERAHVFETIREVSASGAIVLLAGGGEVAELGGEASDFLPEAVAPARAMTASLVTWT